VLPRPQNRLKEPIINFGYELAMTGDDPRSERASRRREGSGLSIGALRAFVGVVDHGSFSRAAAAMGVSQPNISNQINALEQACGARLLNRRSHDQSLTDVGRELYTRARLVISRMNDFEATARLFGGIKRGRLVIGFSTPPFTMPLIAEYRRTYPDIEIGTRLGNTQSLIRDVIECRVDVAMVSMLEPDNSLACHLLREQGLNLVVPADHPFAQREAIDVKELAGLSLILREEGSVTRALTEQALAWVGATPTTALVLESREAVKEAAACGIGFACILEGETGSDRRLKALPIRGFRRTAGVYLVSLRESAEIPALGAFLGLAGGAGEI